VEELIILNTRSFTFGGLELRVSLGTCFVALRSLKILKVPRHALKTFFIIKRIYVRTELVNAFLTIIEWNKDLSTVYAGHLVSNYKVNFVTIQTVWNSQITVETV
jgi:hypothetical protein